MSTQATHAALTLSKMEIPDASGKLPPCARIALPSQRHDCK